MVPRKTVTVLGVTSAGKSTWIGALADGLYRGTVSRVAFDDENWPEQTVGIDRVRGHLQGGEFPTHTSEEQRAVVELPIRMANGPFEGESFALKMSDYDGELIEKLFRDRSQGWDDAWARRSRADCFLVMLRHDTAKSLRALRRPTRRSAPGSSKSAEAIFASSPDDLVDTPFPPSGLPSTPAVASDDPRYVPSCLALVEMLQWIRQERGLLPVEATDDRHPLRVGIVLSAWDSVDAQWKRESPEAYLAAHHALLRDYLVSNFREDEVRVFAVSATGGDLNSLQYREKYLSTDAPLSRVWWSDSRGHLQEETDLSVPLCWGLYGEAGIRQ